MQNTSMMDVVMGEEDVDGPRGLSARCLARSSVAPQ